MLDNIVRACILVESEIPRSILAEFYGNPKEILFKVCEFREIRKAALGAGRRKGERCELRRIVQ